MTQKMESEDKDFKIPMLNILKNLRRMTDRMGKEMESCRRKIKKKMKEPMDILELKTTMSEINNTGLDEQIISLDTIMQRHW